LEDLGVDGKVTEWIHLAQENDQWWALVNTVMKLQVLLRKGLLAYLEGLCSMESVI